MNRQQMLLLTVVAILCVFVFVSSDDDSLYYQETLQIGRGQINHVAWNPNSETILAVGYTQVWLYDTNLDLIAGYDLRTEINAMLWNIDDTERHEERAGRIVDVIWSPDGRWFAVKISPNGGTPRWQLWQSQNNEFTRLLPNIIIDDLQWSLDGEFFSIISPNVTTIYDTQSQDIISTFEGNLVSWSDDNSISCYCS